MDKKLIYFIGIGVIILVIIIIIFNIEEKNEIRGEGNKVLLGKTDNAEIKGFSLNDLQSINDIKPSGYTMEEASLAIKYFQMMPRENYNSILGALVGKPEEGGTEVKNLKLKENCEVSGTREYTLNMQRESTEGISELNIGLLTKYTNCNTGEKTYNGEILAGSYIDNNEDPSPRGSLTIINGFDGILVIQTANDEIKFDFNGWASGYINLPDGKDTKLGDYEYCQGNIRIQTEKKDMTMNCVDFLYPL